MGLVACLISKKNYGGNLARVERKNPGRLIGPTSGSFGVEKVTAQGHSVGCSDLTRYVGEKNSARRREVDTAAAACGAASEGSLDRGDSAGARPENDSDGESDPQQRAV